MKKKRIAILGSTGSIGQNALDVIRRHRDRIDVVLLSAQNNVESLAAQVREFSPKMVAISQQKVPVLKELLGKGLRIYNTEQDLSELVTHPSVDLVLIAMSGAAALSPFLSAVKAGKVVAPANKEALVIAGEIIMRTARKSGARIVPVDSEQSAIFQCLLGQRRESLRRIVLTASGGSFRDLSREELTGVTVEQALAHPNWSMGNKLTVDSATMMNKGFEVIEAQRLFALAAHQVAVVVHPEAIVHSLVEFCDGSMIAQMGPTDMRVPIQYALTYPQRWEQPDRHLDLEKMTPLRFFAPDLKRFPLLGLAFEAARKGGTLPAVMNAAYEVAVGAFLDGRIPFLSIARSVMTVVRKHRKKNRPSVGDILEADRWAREQTRTVLKGASCLF